MGGLLAYVSNSDRKDFQPMNISFGLIDSYVSKRVKGKRRSRKERREAISEKALEIISQFGKENRFPCIMSLSI